MTWVHRLGWLVLIGFVVWGVFFRATDDTDRGRWRRSGLSLYTDAGIGCQYLGIGLGGLTPRMTADGHHMGCQRTQ